MDVRDEITGSDEYEDTDQQCRQVDEEDDGDVQFHRSLGDVIDLRIKGDDACQLLDDDDSYADDVAPEESLSDDEHREP